MSIVYILFLRFYFLCLYLLSFTNKKANLWLKGRREQISLLKNLSFTNCIWFHTSSLGEFEQVSFLIETIKRKNPTETVVVTFFSPSGYEIKKNFKFADVVLYLPFDFKDVIEEFISSIHPKLVFWVRYEFWLNALEKLKKDKTPLFLLNGVFHSKTSFLYKPYLKKCLSCFTEITVINSISQENLSRLGFSSKIIYDTRYSRMNQVLQTPYENDIVHHFGHNNKVVVCGSIWPNDDNVLKDSIYKYPKIHWILVPHEVDSQRIEALSALYPGAQLYSQYDKNTISNILIIDRIGLLSRIYRFADLAYVGGGFNKVVHSLVEPLAYAIPIIIGPHIEKSEEAKDMVSLQFVKQITTNSEFDNELSKMLIADDSEARRAKQNYFKDRINSIDDILRLTRKYISLNNS